MRISVQLEAATQAPSDVRYLWNSRSDVLSAQVAPDALGELTIASCGSVGLQGHDGSWLMLELVAGQIAGVEVAAWPKIQHLADVAVPANVGDVRALVPKLCPEAGANSLAMGTRVLAEADPSERNFHFMLGRRPTKRTVRIARDLLLDVDERSHITGLWLLNVPPCHVES